MLIHTSSVFSNGPPTLSTTNFDDSWGPGTIVPLVIYCMITFPILIISILFACRKNVAWIPQKVYTDGVLVWLLPVFVVTPALVWPVSLTIWGIICAYRKARAAEEFCGISRSTLRRGYRNLRGRLRGGYEELDPEQPMEDGPPNEDVMLVDSVSTDDEGGPKAPTEQEAESSAGSKNIQDEPVLATTRVTDVESVNSEPPEYRP